MIEYRKAVNNDINSLKELWLSIFEDKKIAVELFFERKFNDNIAYVATENQKVVSMLYLLPASVNGVKTCYLYGAATEENYRNQGIMRNLIDFSLETSDYDMCVLLPAKESLYNFYTKLGFENLSCNTAKLSRQDVVALAKPYVMQDLIVNNYCGIRNRVLKSDFLFWNNDHINYAFEYNSIYGAKIIRSNYGYAIAFEEDDVCYVSELICDDKNAPFILTELLSQFSSKEFKFHLSPNQKFVNSQAKTFGMVKYLSDYKPCNIYCGLTLD